MRLHQCVTCTLMQDEDNTEEIVGHGLAVSIGLCVLLQSSYILC